jgi:hypothetical protein
MSFFDSEIVREEARSISELQQEIIKIIPTLPTLSLNEKVEYFDKMISLIERQKIFYNRLSLSDDPKAQDLKEQFRQAAMMLGMPADHVNMNQIYDNFIESMEDLRRQTLDGTL